MKREDEGRLEPVENRQAGRAPTAAAAGRLVMLLRGPERRSWLLAAVAIIIMIVIAAGPRFGSSATGGDPTVAPVAIASQAAASPIPAMRIPATMIPATVLPGTQRPAPLGATPSPSTVPSATPTSQPTWTMDLRAQLECDGPPANVGGEVGDVYGEGLSPESPDAAMDVFVTSTFYTSFPASGYRRTHLDEHWVQFAHLVGGRAKAVVVLRNDGLDIDPGIWSLAALQACDPAEFTPGSGFTGALLAVWLDADGVRVPTTTILETQGPSHCDWQSATWLTLAGVTYLRDPKGILHGELVVPFGPDVKLPEGARSTGYHEGGRTIWRDDDPRSIYVVNADGVERWPQLVEQIGCM